MPQKNDKLKNDLSSYAKYSGVAFEMLGIIVLGVWGGIKLDAYFGTKPLLTLVLSLLAVAAAMYALIAKATKKE
jgi:F0F1-type ATP synthase assembly protein I